MTLCEARDKAPGMMRKLPNFTPSLFETLMLFLLDVEVGVGGCVFLLCVWCAMLSKSHECVVFVCGCVSVTFAIQKSRMCMC